MKDWLRLHIPLPYRSKAYSLCHDARILSWWWLELAYRHDLDSRGIVMHFRVGVRPRFSKVDSPWREMQ